MKYLENFNKYNLVGKLPLEDQVQNWIEYLDKNYPISIFQNMKSIQIDNKGFFLSEPFLSKSRLKEKIFFDIKNYAEEYGSVVHYPSLRKAIKIWIDKNSSLKESVDSNFDVDFAIAKIQEKFPFDKVKQMLDKEVLEWTPEDEDGSYYSEHSNGEAEDAIITHLIDWYSIKYPSSYSEESEDANSNYSTLRQAIQKTYNFLNY
jgi:hypothetical protein